MYRRASSGSDMVVAVLFGLVLCVPFLVWGGIREYNDIVFKREVGGHLKRAADANSLDLAKKELATALAAMEKWNMTSGYTSILYTTPDEDVGFWYTNIKACLTQINELPATATQGEKDLVLLKLRETLLDHGDGHEHVTMPAGISVFPHNTVMCVFLVLSSLLGCVGLLFIGFNLLD